MAFEKCALADQGLYQADSARWTKSGGLMALVKNNKKQAEPVTLSASELEEIAPQFRDRPRECAQNCGSAVCTIAVELIHIAKESLKQDEMVG